MNYQKIMDTTGVYSLQEHLMAMKQGYKSSRLSFSLKENVMELKFNRNADAQRLVYSLLENIDDSDTIENVEKIDTLLQMVSSDKIINNTPHTFEEYFEKE